MEKKAFLEQLGTYTQDLRNYLFSHLHDSAVADDLANDCLLQAAELYGQDRFDETKSLKNWLFCMAYSRLIDHVRREANCRRHQTRYPDKIREALGLEANAAAPLSVEQPSAAPMTEAMPSPSLSERRQAQAAYARRLLQNRFADLPLSKAQRNLLKMRYIDQLTYKQIATKTRSPLSTIISRHACAIHLLRGEYAATSFRTQKPRPASRRSC